MIREKAFDGEEKQFKYTETGLLLEMLQPNVRTIFDYHPDGQVSDKHFIHRHSGQQQSQHFDYNLNHQLSAASNEHSQNQYCYNQVGQLV